MGDAEALLQVLQVGSEDEVVVELQSLQVTDEVVVVVGAGVLGSHELQLLSAEAAEISDNKETRVVLDPRKSDWEGMMLVGQSYERIEVSRNSSLGRRKGLGR